MYCGAIQKKNPIGIGFPIHDFIQNSVFTEKNYIGCGAQLNDNPKDWESTSEAIT
ncbi:hypothetical protein CAR_50p310 (plasmid) [Carnobacterium sp. 17-4]|nr:hypothetical protein CAR_50p310 [Carnobacterium sp. 17-4]